MSSLQTPASQPTPPQSTPARPIVLVDSSVLRDEAIVPNAWLDGLDCRPYESGALLASARVGDLASAEGLVVRSMTRVDAAALRSMPSLRAVATLSSGCDHLDLPALADRGVALFTGHGGNAVAVADWVLWALCRLWRVVPAKTAMAGRRVVVVGVGAVGGEVMALLRAHGADCVPVDPPRAARDPLFVGLSLAQALIGRVDALTLHVPLERHGAHPTVALVDATVLDAVPGAAVLQASRGGVLDEAAARRARSSGKIAGLALDVFVGEPLPDPALVAAADLVTPHIAGHSAEGKVRVAGLAIDPWRRALIPDAPPLDIELACAFAHAQTVALVGDGAPAAFASLDAADTALRELVGLGASFRPQRARHRRCELAR